MAPPSMPGSPTSPKNTALATVQLQATQFFDNWSARVLKTSLGKSWNRDQCMIHALELLALNGVAISSDDIQWMVSKPEEAMIIDLCSRLTIEQRAHFETMTQTLQVSVLTAARVRMAVDSGNDEALCEVMAEEDHGQIKDAILKEAVVCGSREVGKLYRCQETWVQSIEKNMMRLTRSAATAAEAHQTLLKVESQLEGADTEGKAKMKKVLAGFLSASDSAMMGGSFAQWAGHTIKTTAERKRRQVLDAELTALEMKIFQSKEASLANFKAVVRRNAGCTEESLLRSSFAAWQEERENTLREKEEEKALNELSSKLQSFDAERLAKAKKVMARMGAESAESTKLVVFQGFVQAVQAAKAERQVEEATKAMELKLSTWKQDSKNDARAKLERRMMLTDSAVLQSVMNKWAELAGTVNEELPVTGEVKKTVKLMASLKNSLKGHAGSLTGRTFEQDEANLLMQIVQHWELEAKVNRVEKWYKTRLDSKRKQLDSVRVLFRSFAEKLEQGLAVEEADSSRIYPAPLKKKGLSGSVSLPDIHTKKR